MSCLRVLFVCCSLVLSSIPITAQTIPPAAKTDEAAELKKREMVEKRALAMLDEIVDAAPSLRLPENRVSVLATAGDLLWERDEKRARALFADALRSFGSMVGRSTDELDSFRSPDWAQLMELRRKLVLMLATRDPDLAGTFLVNSRPPLDDPNASERIYRESELEMRLAQQIALKNPQLALKRAEGMLERGDPLTDVFGVLETLATSNTEDAQKLTARLAARLLQTSAEDYPVYLPISLLTLAYEKSRENSGKSAKELLTTSEARALIELTVSRSLTKSSGNRNEADKGNFDVEVILKGLKALAPYIEKHSPASLVALKRKWSEGERAMDRPRSDWEAFNELLRKGEVEPILQAAQRAPVEMQKAFYLGAARVATERGEDQRATQIVDERIAAAERDSALRDLNEQRSLRKAGEGKFEEALQLISSKKSKVERVDMLVKVASQARIAGHRGLSAKLLEEAWATAGGSIRSIRQLELQLRISEAYVGVVDSRSFEIVESTIETYNEVFSAAALLMSLERSSSFRDRELILDLESDDERDPGYAFQLAALMAVDADRVNAILGRLRSLDQRTATQLDVVKKVLVKKPIQSGKVRRGGPFGEYAIFP